MIEDTASDLQAEWKTLYSQTLPSLALSRSPTQEVWPVHLDHCFARIILDKVIGDGKPWTSRLKSPAVKNMTPEQLRRCLTLGHAIADGREDLLSLDAQSLKARGKAQKPAADGKRKLMENDGDGTPTGEKEAINPPKKRQIDIKSALSSKGGSNRTSHSLPYPSRAIVLPTETVPEPTPVNADLHNLITASTLTPFRQRVLLALCQVPAGRFTSYAALSDHLQSSARAVGNALRNNPFAPRVPCHRGE
ncbi:MAG: hypothetical protein Q9174_000415 [Haloplaca sp. 1 TL-2023]